MCFFFFKQKTAYEMRISDWSSDVCSSDLWIRRYGQLPLREVPYLRFNPAVFKGRQREAGEGLAGVRVGAEGDRAELAVGRRLAPIGRASCRESVCQYV